MTERIASIPIWTRVRNISLVAAAVGTALSGLGYATDPAQFHQSYLVAFVYWWQLTIGLLGLSLLYQMVGGRWGHASRPFFNSGVALLPAVSLAYLPLAFGLHDLYVWTAVGFFEDIPHSHNRAWYLRTPFFLGRTTSYLAITSILGAVVSRRTLRPIETVSHTTRPRLGGLAAVIVAMVVSFAAFDWLMSLEPEWYSTMYGFLMATGGLLTGLCVVAASLAITVRALSIAPQRIGTPLHDVGKLLLAFLMLWTYVAFSQYLIIYSGNLPTETIYYKHRLTGGWQWLAVILVAFHFALPFGALLSRRAKMNCMSLGVIAIGIAAIHVVEIFWLVAPAFHKEGFALHWLDVVLWMTGGAWWVTGFAWQLNRRLPLALVNWPVPPNESDDKQE
ncbi:MAG: hypothetical protein KDA38_05970 [Planctomycetales bacterium]|nr:hypothetical protein [Planctomycetales bacterium]